MEDEIVQRFRYFLIFSTGLVYVLRKNVNPRQKNIVIWAVFNKIYDAKTKSPVLKTLYSTYLTLPSKSPLLLSY